MRLNGSCTIPASAFTVASTTGWMPSKYRMPICEDSGGIQDTAYWVTSTAYATQGWMA